MILNYSVRYVKNHTDWDACYQLIGKPTLMQSLPFGEAKRIAGKWHVRRLLFERAGTPVALCQVLEKRVAGIRVLSRINRGPLFLDESPSREVKENVFRLLRNEWKHFKGGALLIAPALAISEENRNILAGLGFKDRKVAGWRSSLIDLSLDEGEMRKSLSSQWRNRLKVSERWGMTVESLNSPESVEWILKMHEHNMKLKQFRGHKSPFLAALYRARPRDFVVVSAVHEGERVASMAVTRFGQCSEYFIGWFGDAGRRLNAGNFLYWNAALEMKKAGCRWFDLGGYDSSDKYGQFKQGMRGCEYNFIGEWLSY